MRKLGLVGSLLVVSAGWHALGACTGDEPVAGVLDAGTKDGALPEAAPPGEGGVGSPKLAASVPRAMLRQGGTVEIALTLTRDGLGGDVAVSVTGLPKGVTAEPAAFAGTSTAAKLVLKAAADATLGDVSLTIEAKGAPGLTFPLLVAGASGTLDTTFDTDGEVLLPQTEGGPYAAVVQTDGKIVAVGGVFMSQTPWMVRRINPDGTIDSAFETAVRPFIPTPGEAEAVALDPTNGKIVIVGWTGGNPRKLTILRLLPSGAPDTSFAKAGVYRADAFSDPESSYGHSVTVLSNGDFLVGGITRGTPKGSIEKFLQNGVRDLRFSPYETPDGESVRSVFELPGGGVFGVAGGFGVRLLADGKPDPTFGTGGARSYGSDCQIDESALTSDGDVIMVGKQSSGPVPQATCIRRVAARTTGDVRYSITKGAAIFSDTSVAVAGDRVYVSTTGGTSNEYYSTIERILPDGKIDTSFAKGGTLRLDPPPAFKTSATVIRALATLPDGRLIVAGTSSHAGPFVARYWP
jgi:uncharacterized delta-60 repeat protein